MLSRRVGSLLLDLGDRYLVEAASEKGTALLEDRLFEDADEESLGKAEKMKEAAESFMHPVALWEGRPRRAWKSGWKRFSTTLCGTTSRSPV